MLVRLLVLVLVLAIAPAVGLAFMLALALALAFNFVLAFVLLLLVLVAFVLAVPAAVLVPVLVPCFLAPAPVLNFVLVLAVLALGVPTLAIVLGLPFDSSDTMHSCRQSGRKLSLNKASCFVAVNFRRNHAHGTPGTT